jgi:hypothetical protein
MRKILIMLVVVLFTILSCSDTDDKDDTKDNNNYQNRPRSKPVSGVSVLITSNNNYVIVSWDAIENGYSYNVFIQQENKKSIVSTHNMQDGSNWIQAQNKNAYATADGALILNTDIDKWSVRIPTSNLWTNARYRFGVTSFEFDDDKAASDVTWSSYVQYTK